MIRFLEDFIIPALNDGRYSDKLKWSEEKDVFMVRWLHKSTTSWNEEDTVVFQDWDRLKGHYKPLSSQYLIESKQRFRAALYKLEKIKQLSTIRVDKQISYRRYRILSVGKKKRKNAKKPKIPKDQKVPSSPQTSESDCSLEEPSADKLFGDNSCSPNPIYHCCGQNTHKLINNISSTEIVNNYFFHQPDYFEMNYLISGNEILPNLSSSNPISLNLDDDFDLEVFNESMSSTLMSSDIDCELLK